MTPPMAPDRKLRRENRVELLMDNAETGCEFFLPFQVAWRSCSPIHRASAVGIMSQFHVDNEVRESYFTRSPSLILQTALSKESFLWQSRKVCRRRNKVVESSGDGISWSHSCSYHLELVI
jgi:hypothetical protein